MHTVHNERVKITATFLNGIAIAIFIIGTFAPAIQVARATDVPVDNWARTVVIGVVCIAAAGALHFTARAILGRLRD
jgi:hypothetical protein